MSNVTHLSCIHCNATIADAPVVMTCPTCGPCDGILDVVYDLDRVEETLTAANLARRPLNHWRYAELLPIETCPDTAVGWTPISQAPALAAELGVGRLILKDDGRNPSASFKDRASAIGVVRARQAGSAVVACASTGNAATSLAGQAAQAGLDAVIFVPRSAPEPKLAQLLIYGATVFRIQGTYDEAYNLCSEACEAFDWYNRNCAINPFLVEGKKTAGLEIAEQCRHDPPDWVAVSVGDGCTIAGIGKGLRQMHQLGLLDRLPRLLGVQAEGMAPIAKAFRDESYDVAKAAGTLADSINVAVPRNGAKAVHAVRDTHGAMVEVTDGGILKAMRQTGRLAGFFAEPAAAAAVAGVRVAVEKGIIDKGASVLAMITGNGLKDIRSAMQAVGQPIDIPPRLANVQRFFDE